MPLCTRPVRAVRARDLPVPRGWKLLRASSGARRSVDCAANTGTWARRARDRNGQELARASGEHDAGRKDRCVGRHAGGGEGGRCATGGGALHVVVRISAEARETLLEREPGVERDLDVLHLRRGRERGGTAGVAERSAIGRCEACEALEDRRRGDRRGRGCKRRGEGCAVRRVTRERGLRRQPDERRHDERREQKQEGRGPRTHRAA